MENGGGKVYVYWFNASIFSTLVDARETERAGVRKEDGR